MDNVILSILSLFIGVLATIFVSRYYFQRSVKKALTPYIDFSSDLLRGIDPEVRSLLVINYQGLPVEDLFQIQFLIANTGEKAIRDLIQPLTLKIPDGSKLMDANIRYISPTGRKVEIVIDKDNNEIHYTFPLLNKDEFFITKLLISGSPKEEDFKFSISVDDIPPVLKPQYLPYEEVEIDSNEKKGKIDFGSILGGLSLLVVAYSLVNLSLYVNINFPHFKPSEWIDFFKNIAFLHISVLFGWLVGIVIGLIGIALIISGFEDIRLFKKKKFLIPDGIISPRRFFLSHSSSLEPEDEIELSEERE